MSSLTQLDVAKIKGCFGLQNFVETGCESGNGIAAALSFGFQRTFSCDIDSNRIQECRQRFAGLSQVELFEGESVAALAYFCPRLVGPTLFWLDAHFPTYYGLQGLDEDQIKFPVRAELETIAKFKSGFENDVVAIDDLRVVNASDNPRWREGEIPDYFHVKMDTLRDLILPLLETHDFAVHLEQEGIGLLTPR